MILNNITLLTYIEKHFTTPKITKTLFIYFDTEGKEGSTLIGSWERELIKYISISETI